MKKLPVDVQAIAGLIALSVALFAAVQPAKAQSGFEHFINVRGDQLMDGGQPFRFISFNLPNLQMIEDNLPFAEPMPCVCPTSSRSGMGWQRCVRWAAPWPHLRHFRDPHG